MRKILLPFNYSVRGEPGKAIRRLTQFDKGDLTLIGELHNPLPGKIHQINIYHHGDTDSYWESFATPVSPSPIFALAGKRLDRHSKAQIEEDLNTLEETEALWNGGNTSLMKTACPYLVFNLDNGSGAYFQVVLPDPQRQFKPGPNIKTVNELETLLATGELGGLPIRKSSQQLVIHDEILMNAGLARERQQAASINKGP